MPQLSLDQALDLALSHHQAGRLPQAEEIYTQILAAFPQHPVSLHLLGVLKHQTGNHDAAIELISKAIALDPNQAPFHANLGVAYAAANRLHEALACQQRAVQLQPNFPEALGNLGLMLHRLGKSQEALEPLRRSIAANPAFHDAHRFLGDALYNLGQIDDAVAEYRLAISLTPANPAAHHNLAVALTKLGRTDEAVAAYRNAISADPRDPVALQNFGELFISLGRNAEAHQTFDALLKIDPTRATAWCGIGHALKNGARPDEAIAAYQKAIECDPAFALAHAHLACAVRDRGQIADAIAGLRRSLALDPTAAAVHSNLILTLYLDGQVSPDEITLEKNRWNQRFAQPLAAQITPHTNDRTPERRLRVGYVSPDFREHPVGRLMQRILDHHDRTQSEIFCYSSSLKVDAFTEKLRAKADQWRMVESLDDDALAALIRADKIDILVDLAMHTINGRLLTFARKPAPLQISYLAYPDGTGVSTIDYRLTDPYLDPPNESDDAATFERPLRLPDSYWCYAPAIDTPPVKELPALTNGHITFGALNDFCKITPDALETWAELLTRIPTARLIMHVPTGSPRRAAAFFTSRGIDLSRLEFPTRYPIADYFAAYQKIDIALAGFPYAGGTTMSDALWMGVPPITLAGQSSISRAGLSVLSNVGLPELVAYSPEQYITLAATLAADLPRLAELRRTLRQRLQNSPLGNAPQFTHALESAYRQIWREWCRQPH